MSESHSFDDRQAPAATDVDEAYWSALLEQGEFANNRSATNGNGSGWSAAESNQPLFEPLASQTGSYHEWLLAKNTFENDQAVDLSVTGYNKGGLLVSWDNLRGFVPASQLINFPVDVDEVHRRSLLARYVSRKLKLRIIELDITKNRLILSERAAQVEAGQRATVMRSLCEGTVHQGVVTNLCDFGAFVDLGGVEGLIHISELSWGRVNHPRDVLSSGQEVRVYIMSIDADDERIALSLKRLQPDPWETVSERYKVGQIVEGVVTNVVDFGAFACIEEGLEGLIHISELAEGQFLHPRNVVNEGDKVRARILNIDGPARRLGLSLRLANVNGDHVAGAES